MRAGVGHCCVAKACCSATSAALCILCAWCCTYSGIHDCGQAWAVRDGRVFLVHQHTTPNTWWFPCSTSTQHIHTKTLQFSSNNTSHLFWLLFSPWSTLSFLTPPTRPLLDQPRKPRIHLQHPVHCLCRTILTPTPELLCELRL